MLPVFDPIYLLFILPALLLSLIASIALNHYTNKYSKVLNKSGLSGLEIAQKIAIQENLRFDINIIPQNLGDSYDTRNKTLNLSHNTADSKSITAIAIAAHEVGHVYQEKTKNILFKIRSSIVPIVNFGTNLGYYIIIIGLIVQLFELAWIGLILFSLAFIFSLITVPLEIDASLNALKLLQKHQLIFPQEKGAVKSVLISAALTYVAALLQSFLQLLYFFFRVQGLSRKNNN